MGKICKSPGTCVDSKLTWWLGKMSVSAITTFCLRDAAKTMTSAISSGVKGSHPLHMASYIDISKLVDILCRT